MSPPPETPAPKPKGAGGMIAILLSLMGLGAVLGAVIWGLIAAWHGAGEANPGARLTAHGWAALILAFVMVCIVGGGLMWLAFYSARKGYDDRVSNRDE
jgi:MFS family permease